MQAELSFDLEAVEAGIARTGFAGQVRHLASANSTSTLALEAAQAGEPGGVWVADEQTAGRGRGGHTWHSAKGDGLYMSALLRPQLPIQAALQLSLAAALAARAAIAEVADITTDIRWPNDLIVGGRKCGGILTETAVAAEGQLRYAVIGVGINLNHAGFPEEFASVATSLRMEGGRAIARELLLGALLRYLEAEVCGLLAENQGVRKRGWLLKRFAAASTWVSGRTVRVGDMPGYTGVTRGLDRNGFLLVEGHDGVCHTVLSGGVREARSV